MARIYNQTINKTWLAMRVSCIILMLSVLSAWADPWTAPAMTDYLKQPPFTSYAVRPNIMIVLDSSGSMNWQAYTGGFVGEPYDAWPINYYMVGDSGIPLAPDDMEENPATGVVTDNDGDGLDLGTAHVGIRFQDLPISQGAIIDQAYIQFTANGDSTGLSDLVIRIEDSADASPMDDTAANNISGRTYLADSVTWSPSDWSDGQTYRSDDVTDLLQTVVNRADWDELSNNILFNISASSGFPTGQRTAHSRENSQTTGPVLCILIRNQPAQSYYGIFNPDYFYKRSGGVFEPAYKKLSYDYNAGNWRVETLAGTQTTKNDSDIAPADPANGLWDGNFMNYAGMRRIDVLRKVLVGGMAADRNGSGEDQLSGDHGRWNSWYVSFDTSGEGPAVTPYDGDYTYSPYVGELRVRHDPTSTWVLYPDIVVKTTYDTEPDDFYLGDPAGILQRIGDRARWGNAWFNYGSSPNNGATIANTLKNANIDDLVNSLQSESCSGYTPLAESYYTVMQNFRQQAVDPATQIPANGHPTGAAKVSQAEDPYYDSDEGEYLDCAKSFVLLFTDGAATRDGMIPAALKDYDNDGNSRDFCTGDCSSDHLDDLALFAHVNDLRGDLSGDQNITLYTVYAFDNDATARTLLKNASRNGGFIDQDGDNRPDGALTEPNPANRLEWDQDGDGDPDTYYEASDGATLRNELLSAFNSILSRASSGTAASVVANSRTGEGALYQTIFYPATTVGDDTVKWVGQLQSLMVDEYGNMREDTNGNDTLDVNNNNPAEPYQGNDLVILFTDDAVDPVKKYQVPAYYKKRLDITDGLATLVDMGNITDIKYLWTSSEWLNEISDANITVQRGLYGDPGPVSPTNTAKRYIFTFVDGDDNMVADPATEVFDFVAAADPNGPDWATAMDDDNFWAYLHPYEPFSPPVGAAHVDFEAMVRRQLQRTVNYVRGQDQPMESVGTTPLTLPAFRSRLIDYDEDGTDEIWRMGDIVFSTPTVVGRPAENYDLIWRDESYRDFYLQYRKRRNVIYVGANDGMLHAFNGGFFDRNEHRFRTQQFENDGVTIDTNYNDFALGQELWAYIPYNLLPHLHWLTDPEYGHVYYCDLQPRIFDAKIFDDADPDHPNGWGTVLVAGMRFGGGRIAADIDKSDGAYDAAVDKSMSSAYIIFDVTNPEKPPELLAEITFPELGFTTCHPGVVPMRDLHEVTGSVFPDSHQNLWYLLFGSGPIQADGAYTNALLQGTSSQQGVMYAIDLVKLVKDKEVVTLTPTGEKTVGVDAGSFYWVQFPEADSFVSKPIAIDMDLDFNTEVVYFGTTFGDHGSGWGGKLRRIVPDELHWSSPWDWETDSVMIDLTDIDPGTAGDQGQPITAPATATVDGEGNRWVYFGTGRYFSSSDAFNTQQQSYYGMKEPFTIDGGTGEKVFSFSDTLTRAGLMDVSDIEVYEQGNNLLNYSGTFVDLEAEIDSSWNGWVTDFSIDAQRERNLGQAVLAGHLLTFTTYLPSIDLCNVGGNSMVYALYYRTGTAYYESIFGVDTGNTDADSNPMVLKASDLGRGMTITPNIHVGKGHGSQAYIQTSDGSIKTLEEDNPGEVKSEEKAWSPDTQCN